MLTNTIISAIIISTKGKQTGGNKMEYKIISYRAWDGKKNLEEKSNNLKYFDRYLNKLNFRSQIYKKDGRRWKLIYSEI